MKSGRCTNPSHQGWMHTTIFSPLYQSAGTEERGGKGRFNNIFKHFVRNRKVFTDIYIYYTCERLDFIVWHILIVYSWRFLIAFYRGQYKVSPNILDSVWIQRFGGGKRVQKQSIHLCYDSVSCSWVSAGQTRKYSHKEGAHSVFAFAFLGTVTDERPEATAPSSATLVHTVPSKHQHTS